MRATYKTISTLVCTILILAGIVWASKTEYSSEPVRILDIGKDNLVVRIQSGETMTIELKEALDKTIVKGQDYQIEYYKKRWGGPTLERIKPEPK
ncbi:hypothetical protein [Paenibacillus sp. SN-8-1]|uniref:hypothetical protein n=1 Tax=Paenibacillus sp. SN-8-1 TaxID=3435409 RepID=UPI003D9A8A04